MEARFEGVRFSYGDQETLDVPHLRLAPDRVTALLGPNGSGKSTLLRLLAGLERPRAGRVLIGGKPAREARVAVAYAFQEAVFLSGSLRANLDLALRLRGLSPSARRARLAEAANACGVGHLLDRPANQLSGGEAQRANLARALSLRAPLTLLDEPLAGFDEHGRRQMLDELPALLRRFAGAALIVTHDRDEALRLAGDLVLLREGRVRASGPARRVIAAPPDPETAAFLGYTLVRDRDALVAFAPGALRPGAGERALFLTVERVTDLVTTVEVVGTSGGGRIAVNFPVGAPPPAVGERVTVSAPAAMVVSFADAPGAAVDSPSRAPVA